MNFVELKEEKVKLERDLAVEIGRLVSEFRQKTGVSIENISVHMTCVTVYGDPQEEYIVGNVSCKVAF